MRGDPRATGTIRRLRRPSPGTVAAPALESFPHSGGAGCRGCLAGRRRSCLTLARRGPYTLPDVDAPGAFVRTARSRAFRSRKHSTAGGGPRGLMERIARSLDEADLPAQEAPPRQGTRLSCPDEVDRRSTDPGRPPRSRPEAADGLIERGTHPPRLVMLSRPRDFATLQGTGAVRSHPLLVVRILRTDLEKTRFGLATGRKLGGAVIRNRLRRRLREALRALAPSFQPGWDVLIIARPALVNATHEELTEAVARLLRRGGVLEGPNSA
jgi:ribonuclease P protein component